MKKDDLMKIEGMTSEMADAVLKEFDGYVPHDRFNEVNEAKKKAEAAVEERDKQIATLKKDPEATETLKATIKKLQDDNKAAAETSAKEMDDLKRQTAVKIAIASDAQDAEIVAGLFDTSKIVFDDQGNVTAGLNEQKERLMKDKPFLFKTKDTQSHYAPNGGGAPAGSNPFKKETFNLTKQGELFKSNPEQAKALAAEAGVTL